MSALLDRAERLAHRVRTAVFEGAFERGVTAFSALLSAVPDDGAADATPADLDRLTQIADDVIDAIEARLEGHRDGQPAQLRLAEAVYRIRAELEELARWRRHFHV